MSNKNIFPIAIKFITFNITSYTRKVQAIVWFYNSIPTYFSTEKYLFFT